MKNHFNLINWDVIIVNKLVFSFGIKLRLKYFQAELFDVRLL